MKKTFKEIDNLRKLFSLLIIILLAGAIGWFWGLRSQFNQRTETITSDTILQTVQAVSELGVEAYHYTNMGKFENSATLNGWTIPLTKKSFILSYDGTITAGINLEKLLIEIDGKTIFITIPMAEIISHEIDENSIEIYDESNNLFNPIKISDYTVFSAAEKASMEERVIASGFLEEAQLRARDVLSQLLILNEAISDYELIFTLQ